ncbi:MAG TPA: ankyrin repeat domain-containing protein [Terriglobales bacterium]|nr:ankyrin repeat domain-containing protein [Terriglobales bacterium]
MPTPTLAPTRTRTNWVAVGFEGGLVLAIAGVVLLYLNPFWHLNAAGFLDPRVHWWNLTGEGLTALGLLMLSLALVGLVAAVVSRCFASRPAWPYVLAAVVVGGIVTAVGLNGFTRDFDARFEWSLADGFKEFRLQSSDPAAVPSLPAANWVWRSLIGVQVQPQLEGYFRVIDWQRVNGHIGVAVVRIIPIAWPIGLGSEGESLEDPDETPLMQAADQGDLQAVQQLLAAKPDVNARDQGGETALIHACRNPKASPALIKALLAAGADLNIRSHNDYTALGWATARGNTAVVQLLRRAGAKP